eukprot:m.139681 g.139681  ORF g.139681 m.139681 type:complete len:319 (+) comp14807_c0_seq1:39-995(+)
MASTMLTLLMLAAAWPCVQGDPVVSTTTSSNVQSAFVIQLGGVLADVDCSNANNELDEMVYAVEGTLATAGYYATATGNCQLLTQEQRELLGVGEPSSLITIEAVLMGDADEEDVVATLTADPVVASIEIDGVSSTVVLSAVTSTNKQGRLPGEGEGSITNFEDPCEAERQADMEAKAATDMTSTKSSKKKKSQDDGDSALARCVAEAKVVIQTIYISSNTGGGDSSSSSSKKGKGKGKGKSSKSKTGKKGKLTLENQKKSTKMVTPMGVLGGILVFLGVALTGYLYKRRGSAEYSLINDEFEYAEVTETTPLYNSFT